MSMSAAPMVTHMSMSTLMSTEGGGETAAAGTNEASSGAHTQAAASSCSPPLSTALSQNLKYLSESDGCSF